MAFSVPKRNKKVGGVEKEKQKKWDRTAVLTRPRKAQILFHAVLFCSYLAEKAQVLFLPGREKLKFCSDPAGKKTHILFQLSPEKQVLTYKRAFLTYGGSFRMEKDDKPSNYDPI